MERDVLDDLAAQREELAGLLTGRSAQEWAAPSRCEGWSVRDVVVHLAQSDELAVASVQGDLGRIAELTATGAPSAQDVESGVDAMVRGDTSTPEEVLGRWEAASAEQLEAFGSTDPSARVLWVGGELAARTLATTRLSECWIHTGDVGWAWDAVPAPTDRLWHVARLAWRTLPHAFTRAGLSAPGEVRFELTAPSGSTWQFGEDTAPTVVTGPAAELCDVAAQRRVAADTSLRAEGPDAEAVLGVVRTFV